ncbi:MAG: class I SAM-dependent methyltransferase [Proteobacteria bacterium]|nr:class I SAM-dependent methyltransferase [Pseudomonadota bacterium]MDA1308479.1 class I SAM-dependent methyltransferase [Pseudomonadota bacterium]
MSGFTGDWLAKREPWDHQARSPEVLAALRDWQNRLPDRATAPLNILDLGCGTGSTMRYLDTRLQTPVAWRLVDGDPLLLDIAGTASPGDSRPGVTLQQADLATAGLAPLIGVSDLVTASALLDLVSQAWLDRFWQALCVKGTAVLAGLTYDGRLALDPPDRLDAVIGDLVNRHQRTDKGFGSALGPHATAALATCARQAGWSVTVRRSDWTLAMGRDAPGIAILLDGWAAAAKEIAPGLTAPIDDWRARRLATPGLRIVVGHRDLLAIPPT